MTKGMEIISVSHQNLLPQNDLLSEGFVLDNHGEVSGLLEKYGVKTHFSGHSHIWHSRTQNGLMERQVRASLSELSLGKGVKGEMVGFAVDLNREYFAGTLENAGRLKRSGAWELWKENGRGTFWYYYLDSILSE